MNVAELADRYLAEHLPKKKESSAREDRRILKAYIIPSLGRRQVAAVTSGEIARLHVSMKSTPIMANRVLFLLSTLFNLAERWGVRKEGENPCKHVQRFRERRRERFLSGEEIARLGRALSEIEAEEDSNHAGIAAIRLLALTGARRGEILSLRWDHIDLEHGMLRLPDSKTGQKVILIDERAATILQSLPRSSPWVFPSPKKPDSPVHEIRKTWERVLERAAITGIRLHDLRHTHASVAAGAGLSLPMIGGLLGHRRSATTERYAHLVDDDKREAARVVQRQIARGLAAADPQSERITITRHTLKKHRRALEKASMRRRRAEMPPLQ